MFCEEEERSPKKVFCLKTMFFSIISPFIVFVDLKVHFSIVRLSFCLLIPLRAIGWHFFAAAWLVARNLQLGGGCQWHVWELCIGSLSPKHQQLSYAGCSGLGKGVFMQCPHPCGFCTHPPAL